MHGEYMNRSNRGIDHSFIIITFTFPLPFRLTELASVSCIVSHCIVSVAVRMEHGVFKTVHQIKNQPELRGATIVNQSLLRGMERHMEGVSKPTRWNNHLHAADYKHPRVRSPHHLALQMGTEQEGKLGD